MTNVTSYTITKRNNETEKEGIEYILNANNHFFAPDSESRKLILEHLAIDYSKFYRTFDMIYLPHRSIEDCNQVILTEADLNSLILIELKTTKKFLPENPKGFFFGATENEFNLAQSLNDRYLFCFVSLHENSKSYKLLSFDELNSWKQHRRVQYQIALK